MWLARNITTQTTVNISTAPCELVAVIINTAAASAVATVFDSPTSTGTKIATIDASATNNFFYGNACRSGLTVVTSGGSADITVIYILHGPDWNPFSDLSD